MTHWFGEINLQDHLHQVSQTRGRTNTSSKLPSPQILCRTNTSLQVSQTPCSSSSIKTPCSTSSLHQTDQTLAQQAHPCLSRHAKFDVMSLLSRCLIGLMWARCLIGWCEQVHHINLSSRLPTGTSHQSIKHLPNKLTCSKSIEHLAQQAHITSSTLYQIPHPTSPSAPRDSSSHQVSQTPRPASWLQQACPTGSHHIKPVKHFATSCKVAIIIKPTNPSPTNSPRQAYQIRVHITSSQTSSNKVACHTTNPSPSKLTTKLIKHLAPSSSHQADQHLAQPAHHGKPIKHLINKLITPRRPSPRSLLVITSL